jgi:hypothetical protein
MTRFLKYLVCLALMSGAVSTGFGQKSLPVDELFKTPPADAKPWVFWYWMHAAVSKEGISADLEAMKSVGIGGAYLMPIQDTSSKLPYSPPARQLSPEWWGMVNHAMKESKRLGLQLAMHLSDGFALAGGPWITPELSMQKLVWTRTYVKSGHSGKMELEQPETNENYYQDVAVYAYPARSKNAFEEMVMIPTVTASNGVRAQFLCFQDDRNAQSFKCDSSCWIQYKFAKPFTCRSLRLKTSGNNFQAQRLILEVSDDGVSFTQHYKLEPPRHGWQDTDEDYTYAIPEVSAQYYRFIYDKEGSEPGSEDLDAAKWKPSLKIAGIHMSDEPVINQIEAKNGSVWRVATNTSDAMVGLNDAVPLGEIINLTEKVDHEGVLDWTPPAGNWVIVRIGHTSTGHTNATGGAGRGLECDKFNAQAVKIQFNNWFAKAFENTDRRLAKDVLKIFHVDSWECGSQNWSKDFAAAFKKKRGYDLQPYLLVMTGVPVESAAMSERILHDVRETILELVSDVFYTTLKTEAHRKGCRFSAESVAPTMLSDGLLHYKQVDLPMGEFWLNSPTHDKPNDMFDAISGAHIYGKNIIQAEAFTTLRMDWSEHPGNLKVLGDRNFALGINRMVLHVFAHNPFIDKKPGVTLDGVGLYFQRDQTWFKQSKAWIDYLTRVSAMLQQGKPVTDIAVFTGEEAPRRSILPDRLISTLPGVFGRDRVDAEAIRLKNTGLPLRQEPEGVTHSANMADPENWTDAMHGYKYDCVNPDALLQMQVENGRIVLPGGASYAVLVIPGQHPMHPNANLMSEKIAQQLLRLVKDGATIIMPQIPYRPIGHQDREDVLTSLTTQLYQPGHKGRMINTPFTQTLSAIGLQKDLEVLNIGDTIAWTHRRSGSADLYFVSNQREKPLDLKLRFRVINKGLRVFDPVTGIEVKSAVLSGQHDGTNVEISLQPNQSLFFVFDGAPSEKEKQTGSSPSVKLAGFDHASWTLKFDPSLGGPSQPVSWNSLGLWSESTDTLIKYYSGTVIYSSNFNISSFVSTKPVWLNLGEVYNLASVKVNGIDCGTIWTYPYRTDISKAVRQGSNSLEIAVTNTWANRLNRDQSLPENKRLTWTTAPIRLGGKPLLPAGLNGPVLIEQ